jgi:putative ABC transport system permease protein
MDRHEPSRIGWWLLRLRAGDARRAEVEDDLRELFQLRAAAHGPRYAQWRFLRDALSVTRPPRMGALRESHDHAMAILLRDLRASWRALAAQPRFTAIAVVVTALGIGITTAVFSVVNAVLIRPLPYANPERLVAVTGVFTSAGRTVTGQTVALTDLANWRPGAQSFESIGGFAYTQLPIRVGERTFSPVTALMDPEFLPTLGKPLALGTFFAPGSAPRSDLSAIISHALWRDAFGGDPAVIGRTISIDGEACVVRGVLAADFQFPRSDASYFTKPVDLLMPSSSYGGFPASATQWFGIGRLRPGVSMPQAEAELGAIAAGLAAGTNELRAARLVPLAEETTRRSRQALQVVLAIAIVLLLVAATNLMNLFFARGVARLREMSIRRAMGSSTAQLVRLLLVESLIVAIAGGVLGILLALSAIRAIVALLPVHLPVTASIDVDRTVLGFTALLCVGTAIVAGLVPALHVSARTESAIRHSGLRATTGRAISRVQQGLCVAQIALGMALLTGAGLLANSLWQLRRVDPGFDANHVFGFNLSVPNDVFGEPLSRFYEAALQEVRTIPGVERAGLISFLPPETRAGVFMGLTIDGVPPPERGSPPRRVNTLISSVDYFQTIRVPVVRGRDLRETDGRDQPPVVVVNEAFVRRYLPNADPIGQKIGTGFDSLKPVREIVGVVRDSHDRGVAVAPIPTAYLPVTQFPLPYGAIVLRTTGAADTIVPVIRDRLHRLNPSVPLTDFQMLDRRLIESLREPRFYTLMAMTCALMAVVFVTFGLYGLISYSVGRRTAELGIRLAIGAQRGAIVRMVLGQGLRLAAIGVALGLALAVAGTRALTSLLFGVQPIDAPTFGAAAAVVIFVTLAASYAPARRAGRVSPVAVLRSE